MVTKTTAINLVKTFVSECNKAGLSFNKVMIFGSVAKGENTELSDIDLLLVSDQFTSNIFDNLKLYSKINIRYPIIETHPYPTNYYLEGDEFLNRINYEGIEIRN